MTQPCDFCGRDHEDSTRLCHRCLKHLETDLADTPGLLADIATNGITYDHHEASKTTFVTSTPADVTRISLLDPRSGVTRVLTDWARIVIRGLNLTPLTDHTITNLVRRHRGWLPWIATHTNAADYAAALTSEVRILRVARDGKRQHIRLGDCPVTLDTGQRCNGALAADPRRDTIRCPKCRTSWTHDMWAILGRAINAS